MRDLTGYRVLAVHAHPDDESITTGAALADFARRGADVTVVTCTLGEEGEVIGDTYQQLIAAESDQLGGFRIGELRAALDILGVDGLHLGGAGHYRDSGMAGSPSAENPRAFVNSGTEAVDLLAEILEERRPHLVLTYGPDGGYGHPDHIRAHEITHAAAERVGVPRILWAVTLEEDIQTAMASVLSIPEGWQRAEDSLATVDHADAAVLLDDELYHLKKEAMRAHATQLWLADGDFSETNPRSAWASVEDNLTLYALSNLIAQPIVRRESYQVGAGSAPTQATELLSGLERQQ